MMKYGWKKGAVTTEGTMVGGDPAAPPTKWWNHWWLALRGWTTIVTFEVPEEVARDGYFVGFTPESSRKPRHVNGGSWIHAEKEPCHERYFSVRIGREPCEFFVWHIDPVRFRAGEKQQPKVIYDPKIIARSTLH